MLQEYTSAGHLPQIIRDNSGPGIKPADLLPARLADNQLHRYSRVLQSNIGNVFTIKSPPTCPRLVHLPHNPLNSSQPTNLAGSQKLLSVGGDIDFPVIPGHLGDWSDGVEIDWLGNSDLTSSGSGIMSWSMFYIFCTVCVFCYIIYRLCHNQYNCRYIILTVL